jgi:SH3-like domain-containing protein
MGSGEPLRTFTNKVDMWRLLKDKAGGLNGVTQALDAGDAAGFHAAAVHEERVELDAAVGGEKAAAASVEGGVIFEDGDGGFNGIEGGPASGEDGVARFESFADA